jgi:hypothetical protein
MTSSRFTLLITLGIALLAGPSTAIADPKDDARDRLEEGSALYRKGDYQGALRKFEQARALFPSAKIYFNLGQAYNRLGRPAAAVDAFERFLDEATDADPARRADATRFLSELEPRIARVRVLVPNGSEVAVDGRPAGVAPLKRGIPVEPGSHQVTARAPGAAMAAVGSVQVDAGEVAQWQAPVAAEPGAAPATTPPVVADPTSPPAAGTGTSALLPAATPAPSPGAEAVPGVPAVVDGKSSDAGASGGIRRWWPWAAGAAAVVVAGVVTTVILTSGGDGPKGTFPAVDYTNRMF